MGVKASGSVSQRQLDHREAGSDRDGDRVAPRTHTNDDVGPDQGSGDEREGMMDLHQGGPGDSRGEYRC